MTTDASNGIVSQVTEPIGAAISSVSEHLSWCAGSPLDCLAHESWRVANAALAASCAIATVPEIGGRIASGKVMPIHSNAAPSMTLRGATALCTVHGANSALHPEPSLSAAKSLVTSVYTQTAGRALEIAYNWVWVPITGGGEDKHVEL